MTERMADPVSTLPTFDFSSSNRGEPRQTPFPTFTYWSRYLWLFFALWCAALAVFFPKPAELLRENCSYIALGFVGAVLGNLSAVGGGIVFIPAMMFVYHLAPVEALKVALASQFFGMSSGAIAWWQRKSVPIGVLKYCVPPLLLGSTVSGLIFHPSAILIKVLFGPVSIALGALTLISLRLKFTTPKNFVPKEARFALALIAFLGGLITGWIAIGEGELVSALLMICFGVEASVAVGLGVVLLAINSVFLALIHQFLLGGIPWSIGIFTGLGCVFGARFAAFVSARFSSEALKIIFSIIAIGDGVMFILQFCNTK